MKKYPIHLGENGTEQFTVTTRVNGEVIGQQAIHDPFIRSTVRLRGFKHAWRALFSGLKIEIALDGSLGASRAIMTLDPHALTAETNKILEDRKKSREAHARGEYSGDMVACAKKPA